MGKIELKTINSGDEEAIKRFYKKFRPRLMGYVKKRINDKNDAEEIVQDALIGALDALPRFKQNSSLYTFICSIARHEIIDFYRKKKIKQIVFSKFPFLEKLASDALGPEMKYYELEKKKEIVKTLKNISEGYSQVLRLKYIEGLSIKEIACNLGHTFKAVESRLFRARLAFQRIYKKDYETKVNTQKFFKKSGKSGSFIGN